jgi:dTDP-4-dehydrorhamnose reductase
MTVLVLGANGQVGTHLRDCLPDAVFWTRDKADLSRPTQLEDAVLAQKPSVIVNAAAYTAVDRAEEETDLAWTVNAEAPAALARAARELGAILVHFSTDYVFDGTKAGPYLDTEPTRPQSAYGATKLAGELAVATLCPTHWIFRTSWVFSEHGGNFVKTMLRLGVERDELGVVDDQTGRPTYAGHIASAVAEVIGTGKGQALPWGIYHLTGGKPVSWCTFAREIFRRAGDRGLMSSRPSVKAITTDDYPTPAKRPANSVLQPSAALREQLSTLPDWEAGLDTVLAMIEAERS